MKKPLLALCALLALTSGLVIAAHAASTDEVGAGAPVTSAAPTAQGRPSAATPIPAPPATATATHNGAPTHATPPKPRPKPTATPIPAPTATATPYHASWHVIGTYSGNKPTTLVTIHDAQSDVVISWTCQPMPGTQVWGLAFYLQRTPLPSNGWGRGEEVLCGTTPASGSTSIRIDNLVGGFGADYVLTVGTDGGGAMGQWTAVVSMYY